MTDTPNSADQASAASVLQAILDTTVDGLITIDVRGRIIAFNKACERIFGYAADEVRGRNVSCLMPEPYHEEHDGYLERYHNGGEARIIGKGREVRGLRKDGSTFPLDLAVAKVEVEGRILYSGIVRDITDRKQAESKILLQNEELGRFAYMASHDLKEPLRTIEAFSELLVMDYQDKLDDRGREYLDVLSSAASRMRAVVDDVLEYSRLEVDTATSTEFDVSNVIKELRRELDGDIQKSGARVTIANELPKLVGDRVRFYRLMQNLVSNAIKYCPPEQPPEVEINAHRVGDVWQIRVQDNGIGIEPEYRSLVFEMFKRLHTREAYSGTGIGLAICRRIVVGWGGDIWIEDAPSGGSVFCFTFPATTDMFFGEGIY